MNIDNQQNKYILQSVENALSIIDLICEHEELGVSEIGKFLNVGKSTAFRLLTTLQSKNYVYKDKNSKYRLSPKFLSIGDIVSDRMEIINKVHPFLVELADYSGETCHLGIWYSKTEVTFIDKVAGKNSIRMSSMIGSNKVAHDTSLGKSLLAFSDEDHINFYLNNIGFELNTDKSIKNKEELRHDLIKIQLDGYSVDNEEAEIGLVCFGAPILIRNKAIAAISISGPSSRMNPRKEEFTSMIKNIADEISNSLQ